MRTVIYKTLLQNALNTAESAGILQEDFGLYLNKNEILEIEPDAERMYLKKNYFPEYRAKYKPYYRRDWSGFSPGQYCTADTHTVDILVKYDEECRPYIVGFQDMRTRGVTMYAVPRPPNSLDIINAFKQHILKFGIPEYMLLDNGRDYLSKAFGQIISHYRINLRKARAYNPQDKPIERFFRSLRNFQKTLGGFKGDVKRPVKKENPRSKVKPAMTFEEFEQQLIIFTEKYNKKKNIADVLEKIQEYVNIPQDMEYVFGDRRTVKVGRNGISIRMSNHQLDFWNDDLIPYMGQQVIVTLNNNLSMVYVTDINNRYICTAYYTEPGNAVTLENIREYQKRQKAVKKYEKKLETAEESLAVIEHNHHDILRKQDLIYPAESGWPICADSESADSLVDFGKLINGEEEKD